MGTLSQTNVKPAGNSTSQQQHIEERNFAILRKENNKDAGKNCSYALHIYNLYL
jgi:hypothetical protein